MVLTDLNTDVHKSVNQFLIDAADHYISKLKGSGLENDSKTKSGECLYITKVDLDKMRSEIRDELQREMIIILSSALTSGRGIQIPEVRMQKEVAVQNVTEEDTSADETTIGLASAWG